MPLQLSPKVRVGEWRTWEYLGDHGAQAHEITCSLQEVLCRMKIPRGDQFRTQGLVSLVKAVRGHWHSLGHIMQTTLSLVLCDMLIHRGNQFHMQGLGLLATTVRNHQHSLGRITQTSLSSWAEGEEEADQNMDIKCTTNFRRGVLIIGIVIVGSSFCDPCRLHLQLSFFGRY